MRRGAPHLLIEGRTGHSPCGGGGGAGLGLSGRVLQAPDLCTRPSNSARHTRILRRTAPTETNTIPRQATRMNRRFH